MNGCWVPNKGRFRSKRIPHYMLSLNIKKLPLASPQDSFVVVKLETTESILLCPKQSLLTIFTPPTSWLHQFTWISDHMYLCIASEASSSDSQLIMYNQGALCSSLIVQWSSSMSIWTPTNFAKKSIRTSWRWPYTTFLYGLIIKFGRKHKIIIYHEKEKHCKVQTHMFEPLQTMASESHA